MQGRELPYEVRVVEESGYGVLGQPAQLVAVVQGEDVGDRRLAGDAVGDLAAEEERVPYGDEVARCGRVLGVEAFGAGEFEAGGAELLGAAGVERLRAAGEFGGLCGEAVAQDLVGAGVQAGGHGSLSGLGVGSAGSGTAVPCAAVPDRRWGQTFAGWPLSAASGVSARPNSPALSSSCRS